MKNKKIWLVAAIAVLTAAEFFAPEPFGGQVSSLLELLRGMVQ